MNNLKRVLSLALSGIMLVGMMAVSASAAEFSDAKDIKNDDAVNFMVALNIINGNDDGSFDPDRVVSRAEMAKMITVALNGGKDPVLGVKTTPTYSDIKGHWAEKYIEYCSSLGVISGRGDGTFDPAGTVTGTEAAKMALVAMGYNSTIHNFVGPDWDLNVNIAANSATPNKLYKGLESIDPSQGLSRDNAAQLLYNAVQDDTMVRSDSLTIDDGKVSYGYEKKEGVSILTEKYGYSVKFGYLTGTSYNDDRDEYSYTIDKDSTSNMGGNILATDGGIDETLTSETDYSALYGQKVKVVYNTDKEAMGIYAASDSKILAQGTWNDAKEADDGKSVKFDGTSYKYEDASIAKIDFNTGDDTEVAAEYTFKAIDNDDNGKVDVIVFLPFTVAKVSFVGKESITAGTAYKFSENDIYEGVKKDDIVMIVDKANTANDTTVITKLDETVEGTVDAVRTDEYRVDGTWYSYADTTATGSETIAAGDDVVLTMVNGLIAYSELTKESATLENLVYVIATKGSTDDNDKANEESSKTLGGTITGDDTLLLFTDGTKKTVKSMRVDTHKDSATGDKVNVIPAVGLYTYKVNKDNIYELKAVKAAHAAADDGSNKAGAFFVDRAKNLPGGEAVTPSVDGWDKGDERIATNKFVADDAIIFLSLTTSGSEKQKVITGKELKAAGDWGDTGANTIITKKVSGLDTVTVAVLVDDDATDMPVGDDGTGYGYVVSKGYAEKDSDGDWTVKFTVWNGEDEVELTATDADNTDVDNAEFQKGAFVSYKKSTTAGEVTDVDTTGMTQAAITGYNGKDVEFDVNVNGNKLNTLKDDDKTVVIYINSTDKAGVEGGEIALAQEIADNVYVKNAVALVTADKKIDVLFVDVNGDLDGATYSIAAPTELDGLTGDASVNGVTDVDNNGTVTSAAAGASVDLKLTVTGYTAGKQTKITATFTCADGTTFTANKTITAAGAVVIPFEMPNKNITGITLALADVTPAPAD